MSSASDTDVIIAGAGPTGLMLAVEPVRDRLPGSTYPEVNRLAQVRLHPSMTSSRRGYTLRSEMPAREPGAGRPWK